MTDNRTLTKRQHYHMRAIFKKFADGEDLAIIYGGGKIDNLIYEDRNFYGHVRRIGFILGLMARRR